MKALLYKDFLVAGKYLRMIFLMDLIFITVSIFTKDNPFLVVFPLVMTSASVTSLISYDERAHFDRCCDMMPVSRRMQVNEKYLVGLGTVLVLGLLCSVSVFLHWPAGSPEFWGMLMLMPAMGLVPCALIMPAIFRLGSERGRIFYFVFYFAFLAAAMIGPAAATDGSIRPGAEAFLAVLAVSAILYVLSWRLSVRFYEAREL